MLLYVPVLNVVLCFFPLSQELKQKFAEQSQVNVLFVLFSFVNIPCNILLNDVYYCPFLCQSLAEAQKGKEQALVDSVSFAYTLSLAEPSTFSLKKLSRKICENISPFPLLEREF